MEKVRPWCGQPSDRGRLKNRNRNCATVINSTQDEQFSRFNDFIFQHLNVFKRVSFSLLSLLSLFSSVL